MKYKKSYLTNNIIIGRKSRNPYLFKSTKNGNVIAALDKYLIVPIEAVPDLESFIKSLKTKK
jgi:hypothetical protein